jgi:hypothetical protein
MEEEGITNFEFAISFLFWLSITMLIGVLFFLLFFANG